MLEMSEKSSFAMAKKAKAMEAEGKRVVHFEIGQPDFETPEHIVEAAIKALRDGKTKYVPSLGIPELRSAIAEEISHTRGINVMPEEVAVTPSGKTAMLMAIALLTNPGDEIIYPDPGFPSYRNIILLYGGVPRPMKLTEENGFHPDPEELAALISPRTKLIILNFPGNPTGAVLSRQELEKLSEVILKSSAYVLSDEIYSTIIFGKSHESIASVPAMKERTFILDGFSKAYAMTGWRLGYLVSPKDFMPSLDLLAVNMFGSTAAFTQYAGLAALRGSRDKVISMTEEFHARRDIVVKGMRDIPRLRLSVPEGAFYAFPNISASGLSSEQFANRALEDAGISLLSGDTYGEYGEGFVRLSFANSREEIIFGLERLKEFMSKL